MHFRSNPTHWSRWIGLALTLCLAACGTSPSTAPITATTASQPSSPLRYVGGSIEVSSRNDDCRITLHGDIVANAVRQLNPVFDQLEQMRCQSKRLVLDAGSGWPGDAITLGAMLRNRGYDTQVMPGSICHTPCLLVFAAGQTRMLPEGPPAARIGFSQLPPDQDFGQQQCHSDLSGGQFTTLKRYLNAMLPAPTATAVLQKLMSATCERTDVYSPAQALALGLATATR